MKRILAVAFVALLAACSSEKEKNIQWEAPRSPTLDERSAVSSASLTLQNNLAYQASTEPTAGAAGLGDQLAASLASAATTAVGSSAKLGHDAVRQAIATGTFDPTCVVPSEQNGVTRYDWTNCVIHDSSTDPYTGETTTLDMTVVGWVTWSPVARETAWAFDMSMAMTQVSGPDTLTVGTVSKLGGNLGVTDTRITAATTSSSHVTESMQGPSGNLSIAGDVSTTLSAGLDYVAVPSFCITGGGLTVRQDTTVYGQTQTDAWDVAWTGCDQFQIRHGS